MSSPTPPTPAGPANPASSDQPSSNTTISPDGTAISIRPTHELPITNATGFSHDQLKQMIDSAKPKGVFGLGSEWVKLSDELHTFATDMRGLAQSTQARWVGRAGDAAQGALLSLADWSEITASGIDTMSSNVRQQSSAASAAQDAMPQVVPYDPAVYMARLNSTSNPFEWVQIVADAYQQYDAQQAAEREAQQVVNVYSKSLHETASTMPAFSPPPTFGGETEKDDPPIGGRPDVPGGTRTGVPLPSDVLPGSVPPAPPPGSVPPAPVVPPPPGSPPAPTYPQQPSLVPPGPVPPRPVPALPNDPAMYPPGPTIPGGSGRSGPGGGSVRPGMGRPGSFGPGSGMPGRAGAGGPGAGRGAFGPGGFGPSGSGSGAPGAGARGIGGLGAAAGLADDAAAAARSGAAGRGGASGVGYGPMAGAGTGGDDDKEHRRPSYLVESEDVWGDGTPVAPPVIGETPPEHYRRG
jgi:hypothetical protein